MRILQRLVIVSMLAVFMGGPAVLVQLPVKEVLAQSSDPVFVGAGDISACSGDTDELTAQLLDGIPGTVFTLGDNAYPDGTLAQFTDCYGPTWGRHKDRTRPSPGNHDYHTIGAAGYYTYFGSAASPLDTNCTSDCKGYYSYNLGAWHIIALNSEIDHAAGSVQEQWLRTDLAGNQSMCTLAYWHKARFSSGANHGNDSSFQPFWQALYDYGADVVLSAHDHEYERFAPQSPTGQADPARGIREFVVGTGGRGLYSFAAAQPNSEVRESATWGVLKLTLHATSYDWEFVPIAGQTFTDAGSGNCVNPASTPTPGPTATATATPSRTSTPTPGPSPTPIATASQTPTPAPTAPVVTSQVTSSADDAEEVMSSGSMNLTSSDLELGADTGVNQWVGMRFNNVSIPRNATILNAYVEFEVDETESEATSVLIQGQAADNALAFSSSTGNISSRPRTTAQVAWNYIPAWPVINAKWQTPNISAIIQEIVNRSGWASGNSMVIIINGTGRRTAEAYDGEIPAAPKLVIQYTTGDTPTPTPIPTDTKTPTPTSAPTFTSTPTATATRTSTPTPTVTSTPTGTGTPTQTPAPTFTPTSTPTRTSTPTPIATASPSQSPTSSSTPTETGTPTNTPIPTATVTPLPTGTSTNTPAVTAPPTATMTPPQTATATFSPTGTMTQTSTATPVTSASVTSQVSSSADDAEEPLTGGLTDLNSSDLELGADAGVNQWVGMRFNNMTIPPGAFITSAYVEFEVDETGSDPTSVVIRGQAVDNAPSFTNTTANLSSRARTSTQVAWNNIPPWTVVNAKWQTPNLAPIIQEIVNRPGWTSGNSIVIIVSGTGRRTAEAYDGEIPAAPKLVIQYATGATSTAAPTPTPTRSPTPTRTPTPNPAFTSTSTPSRTPSPTAIATSPAVTITLQVTSSSDDAEEAVSGGSMNLTSSDLELGADAGVNQWVGIRFNNIAIPRKVSILSAYVEFEVDETGSDLTSVTIQGQANDNAAVFTTATGNISSRTRTTAQVAWNNIPSWTAVNVKWQTPDLSTIIREIVNRPGWASGNSIVIVINGTGRRTAESYNGEPPAAPKLVITYTIP